MHRFILYFFFFLFFLDLFLSLFCSLPLLTSITIIIRYRKEFQRRYKLPSLSLLQTIHCFSFFPQNGSLLLCRIWQRAICTSIEANREWNRAAEGLQACSFLLDSGMQL